MKTLSRPMFNMGGPIKQGIMNGIREPHKHGGPTGTGLVGDQRYPKTGGREHHGFFLAAAPWVANAYRGFKAARTLNPMLKGLSKWKNILPSTRYTGLPTGKTIGPSNLGWFKSLADPRKFGAAVRENPITALTAATLPAQAIDLGREHGADVAKGGWNLAKRYAAGLVPGDQSHWYEDPIKHETVPGVPGGGSGGPGGEMYYDKTKKVKKELSDSQKKAFALKQREERVQKYLEMMGYDRAKKTAIADALIDASKIVGDRGTLDLKNIGQELINPVIQATSKRLDKPEQIREAVGLMATKAEIEKDLSAETDFLDKEYKRTQIAVGKKNLERGFEKDMADFFLGSRTKPDKKQTETYARIKADEYGLPFTKVTSEKIAAAPDGATETEIIQSVVGEDGIYMVGNAMVKVSGGVPKILIGA